MAYTEIVLTIATTMTEEEVPEPFVVTQVARLEFESIEAAERWISAGTDDPQMTNFEYLVGKAES